MHGGGRCLHGHFFLYVSGYAWAAAELGSVFGALALAGLSGDCGVLLRYRLVEQASGTAPRLA